MSLEQLNKNTWIVAIAAIVSTLNSPLIQTDVSKECNQWFCHPIFKKIILFALIFINTHDIKVSFIMTLIFSLILSFLKIKYPNSDKE